MLAERPPNHVEPVEELTSRGILLDGTSEGGRPRLLLQIFSETSLDPIFFEFSQRKDDDGFGEGNFRALFKRIERDQVARSVIQAGTAGRSRSAPLAASAHVPRDMIAGAVRGRSVGDVSA